ncbi:MAG: hypothetical protein GY943_11595, partial [Chloroflexi bacterium]|nr:hypothetical protein [Chloroflexota bacterium]
MIKRPLSTFEQALTLTGQFEPFSVVGVLRLHNGPTPEMLRQALDKLQLEHPLLNVSINTHNKQLVFVESDKNQSIPLQIEPWHTNDQWQTFATAALNSSIDIDIAPLIRCIYLFQAGKDKTSDLIFIYHHAIMDAASGVQFYHRLLTLCAGENVETLGEPQTLLPS